VAFQRGDIVAAMGHYTMAADAGSAEGQARLAWILDQSEQNEEAVKWYRASADQGHSGGQYAVRPR
jgi:TPR repeat protein